MRRTFLPIALLIAVASCTTPLPIFDDGGAEPDSGMSACAREGYAECDDDPLTTCDTHVWADPSHCGACGVRCDVGELCVGGACAAPVVAQAGVGPIHTCARLPSGRVLCWGGNLNGELGDGTQDTTGRIARPAPLAVLGLDEAVDLAVGGDTVCVVRGPERAAACWGSNRPPRFGPAVDARALYARPEPLRMEGAPEPIERLFLTGSHVCALTATRLLCAGSNGAGQLGRPSVSTASNLLGPVEGLPPGRPRAVAVGGPSYGHTCVAVEDGRVFCFGRNEEGQCGQKPSLSVSVPTEVPGLMDVVDLALGQQHSCALDGEGSVWCWGSGTSGQRGDGTLERSVSTPQRAVGLPRIGRVASGGAYVIAISENGEEVWAWGDDGLGQLGRGGELRGPVHTPVRVLGTAGASYEPSAGTQHTCLIERRGGVARLLCAGANLNGQLGRPPTSVVPTFEEVPAFAAP
jgi:alpha-tubulin suppressor-like RCC1 family protein